MADRAKLLVRLTVCLDEDDMAAVDSHMRRREMETNVPLSRSLVTRQLLRERLKEIATDDEERRKPKAVSLARARA
jgi:hypothetical protein